MEGVLRSWAVPKGPSYDTARQAARGARGGSPAGVRRLRGHHPGRELRRGRGDRLGPRRVGAARAIRVEGLAKGKLLFELRGYKLHGMWTLVKIKKIEKDWLLIKERDAWATKDPRGAARRSRCCPASRSRSWAKAATGARSSAASWSASGRRKRPVDVKTVQADAGGDGRQGLHPEGLAVRAQARRLPRPGRTSEGRAAAAHAQRQRLRRELPRDRARGRGAAVRPSDPRRGSRGARRPGTPELSAAPEPRPG